MSSKLSSNEKRRHQRLRSSIGATINNDRTMYHSHLRNISKGGAFVHAFDDEDYRIGQELVLILPKKNKGNIKVKSRVAWISLDGVGLKFLDDVTEQ